MAQYEMSAHCIHRSKVNLCKRHRLSVFETEGYLSSSLDLIMQKAAIIHRSWSTLLQIMVVEWQLFFSMSQSLDATQPLSSYHK